MAARSSLGFLDSTFSRNSDSEHLEITPWTTRLASVDLWIVFALCSTVTHVYVISKALWAADLRLWVMYVPNGFAGTPGTDDILVRGPWLFLQYDLIIMAISSLSWAFALLCHAFKGESSFSPGKVGLMMTVGALTIGPGGTVSRSSARLMEHQLMCST